MLTAKGRAFILFWSFSLFLSWYTDARLAYFISALLSAILIVAYLSFRLSVKYVDCQRQTASSAYEDDEIDIKVTLKNNGYFPEEFLDFSDLCPSDVVTPEKHTFIEEFPRERGIEFSYKAQCLKRGIYTLGPCILNAYDFFGFFRKQRRFYPKSKLVVLPHVFKVGFFPLGLRSSNPRYGRMTMRRSGDYEEFYGIREYTKEDGLRKIHWPISAKHNKLMVRHFEQSSSYIGNILLDSNEANNIGMGKDTSFEYAIKIIASISEYLINKGGSIQLLTYSDKPILSGFGQSKGHYMNILEMLAGLEASCHFDFITSLERLDPLIAPSSSLIVFVRDDDVKSQALLNLLAAKKDLFITEIVMVSSSFANLTKSEDISGISPESAHILKYYVGYQDPLERIFNLKPISYEYIQT